MTALRCDVCGRWMNVVPTVAPRGFSWRCPNEGFVKHVEKERTAR